MQNAAPSWCSLQKNEVDFPRNTRFVCISLNGLFFVFLHNQQQAPADCIQEPGGKGEGNSLDGSRKTDDRFRTKVIKGFQTFFIPLMNVAFHSFLAAVCIHIFFIPIHILTRAARRKLSQRTKFSLENKDIPFNNKENI